MKEDAAQQNKQDWDSLEAHRALETLGVLKALPQSQLDSIENAMRRYLDEFHNKGYDCLTKRFKHKGYHSKKFH